MGTMMKTRFGRPRCPLPWWELPGDRAHDGRQAIVDRKAKVMWGRGRASESGSVTQRSDTATLRTTHTRQMRVLGGKSSLPLVVASLAEI